MKLRKITDARHIFSPLLPLPPPITGNERENKSVFPAGVVFKIIGKRLFSPLILLITLAEKDTKKETAEAASLFLFDYRVRNTSRKASNTSRIM